MCFVHDMLDFAERFSDVINIITLFALCFFILLIVLMAYTYVTSLAPNLHCHDSEQYFTDPSTGKQAPFPSLVQDKASIDLSVIIPAYNEEQRLPVMLDEALEYLDDQQRRQKSFKYEVIVVDDGSVDKTTKVALSYSEKCGVDKVRVCTLERNRGKGGAVRMGMLRSRGRRLLFADADGATKFADIDKLEAELNRIRTNDDDKMAVICGSRAHLEKESIATRSIFRTFLMYAFHLLVRLCVHGVHDTQCGFKLFTRPAAVLLFGNLHVERWAFDVDLLYIAQHFGMHIAEIAVNWQEIPGSKLSPLSASLQMARDLFMIRFRYMTGAWMIHDVGHQIPARR